MIQIIWATKVFEKVGFLNLYITKINIQHRLRRVVKQLIMITLDKKNIIKHEYLQKKFKSKEDKNRWYNKKYIKRIWLYMGYSRFEM